MHNNTVALIVHIGVGVCLLSMLLNPLGWSTGTSWQVRALEPVSSLAVVQVSWPGLSGRRPGGLALAALVGSWRVAVLRSLVLWGLWELSDRAGWGYWSVLPWLSWLLALAPRRGAWLRASSWQLQRLVLLSYVGLNLVEWAGELSRLAGYGGGVALGCVVCGQAEPYVTVVHEADGSYQATRCGHFKLRVGGEAPVRVRLLLLFLGLLETEGKQRGGRRTREGRIPLVRQEQLASWFGVAQEHVSRFNRYWLAGDWAKLLSLKTAEPLTAELLARSVRVGASFPQWTAEQVHQYLRQQGLAVSQAQVAEARAQSGWDTWQATLRERYRLTEQGLQLQESWLIQQLLGQLQDLLRRLEQGVGLTPEVRGSVAELQQLAAAGGVPPPAPLAAQPWLQVLEQLVLGQRPVDSPAAPHCPACGSLQVSHKSRQPRWKRYYDASGVVQRLAVYRYYCHNPACTQKSYTALPPGLTPYSPYRSQWQLLALPMYAWGYSTYRRTGTALGVSSMTAWRWVSAWGHHLLPVAALFGVVKSSGVVGVDEKYVLVPKNDKAAEPMRRWMYVYLAVDVWSYDLLHIAIYAHNNQASAQAFLLALRAKGYHPQVVITDLRQDYGAVLAQVFPQAQHHECLFHALQQLQRQVKEVYGPHYAQTHPEAEQLKRRCYQLLNTTSAAAAEQRYRELQALQPAYVAAMPAAQTLFDFLEHHWPKLVNAIGHDHIPPTNNAVELVIRRFDQHYQNFCGFESLASAQCYLAVFEKLYRFTPFSPDAQARIRGRSPLQLAGYQVANLPLSALCSGWSIDWPMELVDVPNS